MNTANSTKYPVTWARDVTTQFYRRHARASEIVLRSAGISGADVTFWLANSDPLWPIFKQSVQGLERYLSGMAIVGPGSSLPEAYLRVWGPKFTNILHKPIDNKIFYCMLKEQRSREGGEEAHADVTPQPSSCLSLFELLGGSL